MMMPPTAVFPLEQESEAERMARRTAVAEWLKLPKEEREKVPEPLHVIETTADIIYGDTDSVFPKYWVSGEDAPVSPQGGREKADRVSAEELLLSSLISAKMEAYVNILFGHLPPIGIELEKILTQVILAEKKRYAARYYDAFCTEPPKDKSKWIIAKGFEMVRRDATPLVIKAQEKTLEQVLLDADREAVKRTMIAIVTRIRRQEVDISELILSRMYSKRREEYKVS